MLYFRKILFRVIFPIIFIGSVSLFSDATEECQEGDCLNPEFRVISAEELSSKLGRDGEEIWLSLLGKVFDVTQGYSYYGPNEGYSFFAGKDATPTFASGKFNDEGLKADIRTFGADELGAIKEWSTFYEDHETYKFVGFLHGDYYDGEGKPTLLLDEINEKAADSRGGR